MMKDYNAAFTMDETIDRDNPKLFDKKIWKLEDVVSFTGFSKRTIYNKTSKDEIPHRKRGGKLFFLPQEIFDWIDEGD